MMELKRKTVRNGGSYYVALPSKMKRAGYVTMAAQRMILIDPIGAYSERKLAEFLAMLESRIKDKR